MDKNKTTNGGKGSGNFGHAGRLGKIGGSVSSRDRMLKSLYDIDKLLAEKGITKQFGESNLPTFEEYKAIRDEERERAIQDERKAREQRQELKKLTREARKQKAKQFSDPIVRKAILETGDTSTEYQRKHKRAWNE